MTARHAHPLTYDPPPPNVSDQQFRVEVAHPQPDTAVLHLFGEIDRSTQSGLAAALAHVLAAWPRHVVVGLADVDFLGSHGVSALYAVHRDALERGASLALSAPRPIVARVLRITGVDAIMPVYPTMEQALADA